MHKRSKLLIAGATAAGSVLILRRKLLIKERNLHARASVRIENSPEQAFEFWSNLENLPVFMKYLESVRPLAGQLVEWNTRGVMGRRFRWVLEMEESRRNNLIAWRSAQESPFQISGSVEFRPAPANRGTVVNVNVQYIFPSGRLGKILFLNFGKNLSSLMREDLGRFKALLETGEIPTTEGQPTGPRSVLISTLKTFSGDKPLEWARSTAS